MIDNLLEKLFEKESIFVPLIFTRKQFEVLKKWHIKKKLTNAEKKAFYTSIKKKIEALNSVCAISEKEYFIKGEKDILPERLAEAKKLIEKYSDVAEKIFISGSFLFAKAYNDVDIFLIVKRGYEEKWNGREHSIFLTEKRLYQPIFQSAALISVSNFIIPSKIKKITPKLSELMSMYHEAVIEILNKEDKPEMVRKLIFDHELFCKNILLTPKELKEKTKVASVPELNRFAKELFEKLFSRSYLYVSIYKYIKTLQDSIKNVTPNFHLNIFKNNYEELIYGRQRSKA